MKCNRREFLRGVLTLGAYIAIPPGVKAVIESELLKTDEELRHIEQHNSLMINSEVFEIGDIYTSVNEVYLDDGRLTIHPIANSVSVISTVIPRDKKNFLDVCKNTSRNEELDIEIRVKGLLTMKGVGRCIYVDENDNGHLYVSMWMWIQKVGSLVGEVNV